ncbi:MAG: hypothetical protein CO056_00990 [Candidatus Tagabacteria bacterium CG_4_9_14_0_2_um_filter_41_11]|uniref:Histidine phosphatase family protein n=1 Tax=Candidatus Tagabacteria bacterium CG_4_9_14_0_2_um_filter_41_11 TaxID=1975019 RepID=A0A2M8ERE0_9BACT|nr:MAG: hypothetical protein CO056_00990 [Candidatus Tagabacteria bacterium CG_4_9_14_0_2_um_filter_41_11]
MADEKVRRLFLCRHGKTEANEKESWCGGTSDSPLAETGKKQALLLGKALKGYYGFHGKLIISSTRKRARETAKIIAGVLRPSPLMMVMENLREIDIGQWDGKSKEEVKKLFPEEYEEWQEGILEPTFRFNGGESMEEVQKRIQKCFRNIQRIWLGNKDKKFQDIIVVAHSGTNVMILSEIISIEMKAYGFRTFKQDNTCVNIIGFREKKDWHPEMQILLVNSTHHLSSMAK